MWFYMIAGFLIVVGIIGGAASGGIFTLIFLPLGLIMLIVAVLVGMWGRAHQGTGDSTQSAAGPEPLRHTPPQGSATPATPDDLVDARRAQQ